MGVRGLASLLVEKYKSAWKSEDVESVVVDGQGFVIEFYFMHCSYQIGADYARFKENLEEFLRNLQEDNLVASFVFDGSTPEEKMETKRSREIEKMLVVQQRLDPTSATRQYSRQARPDEQGPAPVFLVMYAKSVMKALGIAYVTSDIEADAPLVSKAYQEGAHVVSNDSDLMLMEGPKGFIRMVDFVKRSQLQKRKFQVLTVDAVASALKLSSFVLPELASLVGNDYIKSDKLASFHAKIFASVSSDERELNKSWTLIEALARWLPKHPRGIWHKDSELSGISTKLFDYSVSSYSRHGKLRDIAEDRMHTRVACWGRGADTESQVPMWFVRAFRFSPAFPRQLMSMVVFGVHLCPPLIEALRVDKKSSAWAQSLPIRAAVARALELESFEDWSCALSKEIGNGSSRVDVDFRRQSVNPTDFKHLEMLSPQCIALLRSPAGPVDGEDQRELAGYFLKALQLKVPVDQFQQQMEPLLNRKRWVQLVAIHFWATSYKAQWNQPPRWQDLAALVLMILLTPDKRAHVVQEKGTDPTVDPALAGSLASFEGCFLSALELHAALGSPFGMVDFDFLFDGNFLFAAACGSSLCTFEVVGADHDEASQSFTALLRWLLESLHGQMKPLLRGTAELRSDGGWKFSASESSGAPASAAPLAEVASRVVDDDLAGSKKQKALAKKLQQIEKLETTSAELNAEQKIKVGQKAVIEAELKALQEQTGNVPEIEISKVWSIR